MRRVLVILLCVLAGAACGKKQGPKTSPAPEPTEPAGTPKNQAEKPLEAPAAPPSAPDVIVVSDTTGDTVEEAPAEATKTAEGVVSALEAALDAMAKCDRVVDSVRLKNPAACLRPVYAARVDVRNPSTAVAPDANARLELRKKLAAIALSRLSTEDGTVLLYTLQALATDFDEEPATRERLEALMKHEEKAIASAAASARLSRPRVDDKTTLKLALSLVDSEAPDGVRAAACRYVGDGIFRGNKKHVKLLTERALAPVEASVVRGTAVARLGFIGSNKDIPSLERLFRVPATQYAAVFTLKQGLRTKEGFEAIVGWLEKQADGDKSVQWGTLSAVIPKKDDLGLFPAKRAIKALYAIARSDTQTLRTRAATAKAVGELGGDAALAVLAKSFEGKTDPTSKEILAAIEAARSKGAKP